MPFYLVLYVDACPEGLGAVLFRPRQGVLIGIEYLSAALSPAFVSLPIHVLEMEAVLVTWKLGLTDGSFLRVVVSYITKWLSGASSRDRSVRSFAARSTSSG